MIQRMCVFVEKCAPHRAIESFCGEAVALVIIGVKQPIFVGIHVVHKKMLTVFVI
jgi:hypothetical protein